MVYNYKGSIIENTRVGNLLTRKIKLELQLLWIQFHEFIAHEIKTTLKISTCTTVVMSKL